MPNILHILKFTFLIVLGLPVLGLIIDLVENFVLGLLGPAFHFVVVNFLTFPGVIHHELSHALFAFLTGAQINEIVPFKPDFRNFTLGYVTYTPRGNRIRQAIQKSLTSVAPMICGAVTICILIAILKLNPDMGGVRFLIYYLIFSIAVHMTMSIVDLISYIKGLPVCTLVVFVVAFCLGMINS